MGKVEPLRRGPSRELEAAGAAVRRGEDSWQLRCTINGEAVALEVDPEETILETLRERLRLTGTKAACLEGECGSCTILVDGAPVNACLVLAPQLEGRAITTIEGLARDERLHPVQESFIAAGAVQCGYCTPGLVVAAAALLEDKPNPTPEEVRQALEGNLCRCTGYTKIVDAVLKAGADDRAPQRQRVGAES